MKRNRQQFGQALFIFLSAGLLDQVNAAPVAAWEGCSAIPADVERLACYDRLVGPPQPEPVPLAASKPDTQPVVAQSHLRNPSCFQHCHAIGSWMTRPSRVPSCFVRTAPIIFCRSNTAMRPTTPRSRIRLRSPIWDSTPSKPNCS